MDDYGFVASLAHVDLHGLWQQFIRYVPGRNLHVLFFYLILRLTGGSITGVHALSVVCGAATAAMLYLFIRKMTGLRSVAWATAVLFIVVPNHGESHFWLTALPQNQLSTLLVLCAFYFASFEETSGVWYAMGLYATALFTYDQVFFLWPLLLYAAWRSDSAPRLKRYIGLAGALLAMNVTHLSLRYLSPYASGGRPLIRFSDVLLRCRDAVVETVKGIVPVPTPPYFGWRLSLLVAVAAAIVGFWALRVTRRIVDEEKTLAGNKQNRHLETLIFGLLWAILAYAPNLFWFISPRHNLLPSAGWVLGIVSGAMMLTERGLPAPALLSSAAVLVFSLAAMANVNEGSQWVASARMHAAFARELHHIDPPVHSIFLIGAPRYLHRAPAFNLAHDVVIAAGRELRHQIEAGDYEFSPTRHGLLDGNDLSVYPVGAFHWIPAQDANVISYDNGSGKFECVRALELTTPGGEKQELPLRRSRGCTANLPISLRSALVNSSVLRRTARKGNAPTLLRAAMTSYTATTTITLEWRLGQPPNGPLAVVPRLTGPDGRLLLDAIFPSVDAPAPRNRLREAVSLARNPVRPYPVLWPLVDDEAPHEHILPGDVLKQVFTLRKPIPGSAARGMLTADLFEIEGSARKLGSFSVPVTIKRAR